MSAVPRPRSACLASALAALVWITAPAVALAAPDDRVVTFQVHEDPSDPQSPIRLTFKLELTPVVRMSNAVGWRIEAVEIAQHTSDGDPDTVWRDATPPEYSDELWWVNHADPENPSTKEFSELPQLGGTAASVASAGANLLYSLASSAAIDPTTDRQMARATYSLALESNPETLIVEGEEEPVETNSNGEN